MNAEEHKVLAEAREVYGSQKQIMVAIEELCELAAVLTKFGRYNDPYKAITALKDKVICELADVYVVLDHIEHIFMIQYPEIENNMSTKIARLKRWLDESHSLEHTTRIDRREL